MKKVVTGTICAIVCSLWFIWPAAAEEISNSALNERLKKLEEKIGDTGSAKRWTDRITLSGAVEAEAAFVSAETNGNDTDSSDIALSTVDLNIDVDIAKHVSGHVLFKYNDEDDGVEVDEGFITLDGKDVMPLYLMAGKIYVPFGNYETHMITDPLTQDLGETVEGTLQVGFANDWIDVGLALYQGDSEIDDDADDDITDYALGIQFSLPENRVPDVGLSAGLSILSNIADSNGLLDVREGIATPLDDKVAGMGMFLSVAIKDLVFIEAEYITAMDEFNDNELGITEELKPSAWNIEVACTPIEKLELAIRYAQAQDVGTFLPETQYGLAGAYSLFESTFLALEFLKNEYENDDEASIMTAQLAIEF
jgi:hypothetical protein